MNRSNTWRSSAVVFGVLALLAGLTHAAPMVDDEEVAGNALSLGPGGGHVGPGEEPIPWDMVDEEAALRRLLAQYDAMPYGARVVRGGNAAWGEGRGWSLGLRQRPWRADKRQVRFRQCYFNPISCFRK